MQPQIQEKSFDFTVDSNNEELAKWIIAYSKIPLSNYRAIVRYKIADEIDKLIPLVSDGIKEGVFRLNNLSIVINAPKNHSLKVSDKFVIEHCLHGSPKEDTVCVTFRHEQSRVEVSVGHYGKCTEEDEKLFSEKWLLASKAKTAWTWQGSYDLLAEIAESTKVPPSPSSISL